MPYPPPPSPFTTIPILSLRTALSPTTKPALLSALRSPLLHTGFLYLTDTGLPESLVGAGKGAVCRFFRGLAGGGEGKD
ncbi:predicted protein [Plenodomus lingam JN3]|uniref:Predicted protein n=1 Tax=Leptosphaeria maculans (strain JN3 / isolate v23.1.3 / race Av1-4-5-6-7-8) TaxID=985895 RepID=E5A2H0_LEPMJ|nr:predicted protein [Plenodomus lingam JN3]CBX97766.1 predicted protein [Plenodomus lingam JN3]